MVSLIITVLALAVSFACGDPIPRIPYGPPKLPYVDDASPSYPFSYGPGPDPTTAKTSVTKSSTSSSKPLSSLASDPTSLAATTAIPVLSADASTLSTDTGCNVPASPMVNSSLPIVGTSSQSSGAGTSISPKPTDPVHSSDPSSLGPSSTIPKPGNYTYPGPKGTAISSIPSSPDPSCNHTSKPYFYPNITLPSYPTASYPSNIPRDPSAAPLSLPGSGSKAYPYPNATTPSSGAGTSISALPSSGYYITLISRFNVTSTFPTAMIGDPTSTVLSSGLGGSGVNGSSTKLPPYPMPSSIVDPGSSGVSGKGSVVTDPRPSGTVPVGTSGAGTTAAAGSSIGGGYGGYGPIGETTGVGRPVPVATGVVTPYAAEEKGPEGYIHQLLKIFGLGGEHEYE